MDNGQLTGRVAVVTGAGSGLGRAIASALAAAGATVVANDLRRDAAEATCQSIRSAGGTATPAVTDVSDSVEVAAMFEEIVAEHHKVDILINNAGIVLISDSVRARMDASVAAVATGGRPVPLGATREMTDSQWRRTLSVHLDGTFLCTREALRIMEPRGTGHIVNIASVAGEVGLAGAPEYSAAKAGIIGFTKSVAREVIASGVYVNAVAPGFIDTPILDFLTPTGRQIVLAQTPLGRLGTPDEVAATVMFLVSPAASYFVGQVLGPNGGFRI